MAIAALILFIASQLLFRSSTLVTTYPIISDLQLRDICANTAMAIAIAAIATKPHSLRLWQGVLAAVALAILIYSANRTGDYRLVQGYVLLIAIAGIELDRLCKAYFATVIPIIVLVMLLSIAGLEYNKDVIPNNRLVFSYGFAHPNTTGCLLFSAIGAMTFVYWDRPSWKAPLILSVVAAVFSYISLSSHASAGLLAAIAAVNVIGHIPKLSPIRNIPSKVYVAVLVAIPLCLLGLMLLSTAFYDGDNPLFSWFNNLIHGRPYYAHEYYAENGGFTHLGRKYVAASHYHNGLPFSGVDSGYCQLALTYGLFVMYVLIATYLAAIWKTSNDSKRFLLLSIILMEATYMLVESVPLYIALSFTVLFLSSAFANKDEIKLERNATIPAAKHAKLVMNNPARRQNTEANDGRGAV